MFGFVALVPPAAAQSAPSGPTVTLSTVTVSSTSTVTQAVVTSGTVGETLTITGTGFLPGHPIAITSVVTASGGGTTTVPWLGAPESGTTNFALATAGHDTPGVQQVLGFFAATTPTAGAGCTGFSSFTNSGVSNSYGIDSLDVGGCLTTDANGYFQVSVKVPVLPGGSNTITVTDGTSTVNAPFTINPQIVINSKALSGFPDQLVSAQIQTNIWPGASQAGSANSVCWDAIMCLTGFGSGDSISVTTSATTSAAIVPSCTAGSSPGAWATAANDGACVIDAATPFQVAEVTSGAKVITATDSSTNAVASVTFNILPWVAFYDAPHSVTSFSFLGTAPALVYVEGHGFASGTNAIPANSITIGGVATDNSAITVTGQGTFGVGAGAQVALSPVSNVPFGDAPVVVNGATFDYSKGNVFLCLVSATCLPGTQAAGTFVFGGALISSIVNNGGVAVLNPDKATYQPGAAACFGQAASGAASINDFTSTGSCPATLGQQQSAITAALTGTQAAANAVNPAPRPDQVAFIGYDYKQALGMVTFGGSANFGTVPGTGVPNCPTAGNGGTIGVSGICVPDNNGAVFATGLLTDTAYSNPASSTATTYSLTSTQGALVTNPGSFTIQPWVDWTSYLVSSTTTTISSIPTLDYAQTFTWAVHGFASGETVNNYVGGASFVTAETVAVNANGAGQANPQVVPDLASGAVTVSSSGQTSGISATGTGAKYVPRADNEPNEFAPAGVGLSGTGTLNVLVGGSGTNVILRTGGTSAAWSELAAAQGGFGVHGLLPNTAYSVVWDPSTDATVVATFTSTASGSIPNPGVQWVLGAYSTGNHIVDIQQSSKLGTSAFFGVDKPGDTNYCQDAVATPAGSPVTCNSAYGDLVFAYTATLTVSPSVGYVGTSQAISGTGLAANTLYDVSYSANPALPGTTVLATVTSTATGTVPSGTSIVVQQAATVNEKGTIRYFDFSTPTHYTNNQVDASGQTVLAASAVLNTTVRAAGGSISMTADGLNNAGAVYGIIFNYQQGQLNANTYTGTQVGAILPNNLGHATSTFSVPAGTAPGTYPVQLVVTAAGVGGLAVGNNILNVGPSVTVTSGTGTGTGSSCNSTACYAVTGTPSQTTLGSNVAVQITYTNNSNGPVTAIVYAVVHNSLGQTVAYSTATLPLASGASGTAYPIIFGLPSGSYSVTLFVTSTTGVALSTTSTVSVSF